MSDLKLYNGINNIDDDLIEEADCKKKPVIHHCYGIAASAAAIFIAVGALGVFRSSAPVSKTDLSENNNITVESTAANATEIQTTSQAITEEMVKTSSTAASPVTSQYTAVSTQPVVSYSKINEIQTNSLQNTTAVSAAAAQTEAISKVTTTIAVKQDSSDIQNYDYEYEGSIIMKKYAAALAAFITASSTAQAFPSNAVTYEHEISPAASSVKNFIDECNIDLDLNSDGNFDMFDIYALFRCECERIDEVPDYIRDKYESMIIRKKYLGGEAITMKGSGSYQDSYYLDWIDLADYYFTYYDLKTEYFDQNYYLDNCPDKYNDPVPLDLMKEDVKDIKIWTTEKFYQTGRFVKNDDGTFRPFTADDVDDAYYYDEEEGKYVWDNNYLYYHTDDSSVHRFIRELATYSLIDGYKSSSLMDDIVNSDYVDTDINSDGVYDFDDIVLVAYYINTYKTNLTHDSDIYYLALKSELTGSYSENYPAELRESPNNPITEKEWNKARDFVDTASFYYISSFNLIRNMAENYLENNEVDPKYFDPVYYEKNNFAHYQIDDYGFTSVDASGNCKENLLFDYLGSFEKFYLKYGPSAEKNRELFETAEKYEIYTDEEIDAAFPTYYKNVKTGVLPEPDMNLDGKLDIADYIILDNINLEYLSIGDPYSIAPFLRRYPELKSEICISQEAKDNYRNNFDFNNNGISCDFFETKCMQTYIFGELLPQYSDEEALCMEICDYCNYHPELKYNYISYEKLEKFMKANDVDFEIIRDRYKKEENITETDNQVYSAPETAVAIKGDSNTDGTVDLSDSVLIMQALANPSKYGTDGSDDHHITEEGYLLADVDGGGVTTSDALTIQKHLLGLNSIA